MASRAEPPPRSPMMQGPMMTTFSIDGSDGGTSAAATLGGPRRASRRGAPRRFQCDFDGCGRLYTRAEHLQRHQLNHNPREVFVCTDEGCGHTFVRADLLARHRSRHHLPSYVPRHRARSFSAPNSNPSDGSPVTGPGSGSGPASDVQDHLNGSGVLSTSPTTNNNPSHHQSTGINNEEISPVVLNEPPPLLTPQSSGAQLSGGTVRDPTPQQTTQPPGWSPPISMSNNMMQPKPAFYPHQVQNMPPQPSGATWGYLPEETMGRDNFAVWLFDTQSNYGDFNVANLPFLEGGLESQFSTDIPYDHESLTGTSQVETPPGPVETDELLAEFRRQEVLRWFQAFRRKYPLQEPLSMNLAMDKNGDTPALSLEMMRDCLREYWDHVSSRLPIIHQPTFSANRCPTLLLLVMLALGAASLRSRDSTGTLAGYGCFADVVILGLRWEIVTAEEATPPVSLAVAQSLLLLEFYEKLYSSRKLHERAHIYHSATLTLLRRGSPLIGRAGSESPPEYHASAEHSHGAAQDSRSWWIRWAETESMHRVVFAAFMMDVLHAAMFGHAADMAPHEIRLPLPCDDNLWAAPRPEEMRQLDASLRMYGVKPISFLDGLKRAVHGNEVRTHSFGRMIIMSGLLSVGWHLSRRETHLKWLDLTTPNGETVDNSRKVLLNAFDQWKTSFDNAQGTFEVAHNPNRPQADANGLIQSAPVLYHLAHISLHADIVDCQVYAGARQLLGRKVSRRDYANVGQRMQAWAALPSTRHAILHAFKLLHRVLVEPGRPERRRIVAPGPGLINLPPIKIATYSCRSEPDPHRPWIMYYATLSIWSFVCALRELRGAPMSTAHIQKHQPQQHHPVGLNQLHHGGAGGVPQSPSFNPVANYNNVVSYLSNVAGLLELDEATASGLASGLPDLLDCLHNILTEAHSELLKEARERLMVCKSKLVGSGG
ncbi:hypothetical protein RB595_007534 [Gaeumannomyces hyphopodioides]